MQYFIQLTNACTLVFEARHVQVALFFKLIFQCYVSSEFYYFKAVIPILQLFKLFENYERVCVSLSTTCY